MKKIAIFTMLFGIVGLGFTNAAEYNYEDEDLSDQEITELMNLLEEEATKSVEQTDESQDTKEDVTVDYELTQEDKRVVKEGIVAYIEDSENPQEALDKLATFKSSLVIVTESEQATDEQIAKALYGIETIDNIEEQIEPLVDREATDPEIDKAYDDYSDLVIKEDSETIVEQGDIDQKAGFGWMLWLIQVLGALGLLAYAKKE